MKELTIYEKHPEADAYRVGGFYSPYCLVSRDKRFSDAELAAEWHANEVWAWRMTAYRPEFYDVDRMAQLECRSDILRRFATRPHASESDYQ